MAFHDDAQCVFDFPTSPLTIVATSHLSDRYLGHLDVHSSTVGSPSLDCHKCDLSKLGLVESWFHEYSHDIFRYAYLDVVISM